MNTGSLSFYERYFLPCWTLTQREAGRFLSVPLQNILSPLVSTTLYLFIFGVNLGNRISLIPEVSYAQFVVPGLIMMVVVNNAFMGTAFGLFFPRYIGHIVDLLVTPLTPWQYIIAFSLPAIFRGFVLGTGVFIISLFFTDLPIAHPIAAIVMIILSSLVFALFGLLAGLFATSFESLSMYSTFILLPLTYLGGMFYPISLLPDPWSTISKFNPLFYLIDGFRISLLGIGDTSLEVDIGTTFGVCVVLAFLVHHFFKTGKQLRT